MSEETAIDRERAIQDAEQFRDYLVTFRVGQWWMGDQIFEDEITLRLAGVSLTAAISGAEHSLSDVFSEVEAVEARNDHTDEHIEPPFHEYEDPIND